MAGIVDKFKRMWDAPDDEYEYDEYGYSDEGEDDFEEPAPRERERDRQPASSSSRNKVVNINATAKLQVGIFKPERFGEETRSIADELMKTHTVVLQEEFLTSSAVLHMQTTAKSRELPQIHILLFRQTLTSQATIFLTS